MTNIRSASRTVGTGGSTGSGMSIPPFYEVQKSVMMIANELTLLTEKFRSIRSDSMLNENLHCSVNGVQV